MKKMADIDVIFRDVDINFRERSLIFALIAGIVLCLPRIILIPEKRWKEVK